MIGISIKINVILKIEHTYTFGVEFFFLAGMIESLHEVTCSPLCFLIYTADSDNREKMGAFKYRHKNVTHALNT